VSPSKKAGSLVDCNRVTVALHFEFYRLFTFSRSWQSRGKISLLNLMLTKAKRQFLPLKAFVGAVAIGRVLRMLALAKERGFLFLGLEDHRRKARMGLVGAVAEGLFGGMTAGAPCVGFSGFQFHLDGLFGGNVRFRHFLLLD
jgi:hypothetical protein